MHDHPGPPRPSRSRLLLSTGTVVVSVLVLVGLPGPAQALRPYGTSPASRVVAGNGSAAEVAAVGPVKIKTTTSLVYPNLSASVSGSGFRAGPVAVSMDGRVLKRVTVPTSGSFTTTVVVPGTNPPGARTLTAAQPSSVGGRTASTTLRVAVQWAQVGEYPNRLSDAIHEHTLTRANISTVGPLYTGAPPSGGPNGPLVLGSGVIAYQNTNGVIGIDAATGKQLWDYNDQRNDSSTLGNPVYDPSTGLFVANLQQGLVGIDPLTGTPKWGIITPGNRASNNLAVAQGYVYETVSTTTGNQVVAVDPVHQKVAWAAPLADTTGNGPIIIDGRVIIIYDTSFGAYDAATGAPLWTTAYPNGTSTTTATVGSDTVGLLLGYADDTFVSYDPATGVPRWTTRLSTSTGEHPSGQAVADGRIYVTTNQAIYALETSTGRHLWVSPQAAGRLTPLAFNGMILTPTNPEGNRAFFAVLDEATGTVLTTFPVTPGPFESPFIADGVIYFPGDIAYTLPSH